MTIDAAAPLTLAQLDEMLDFVKPDGPRWAWVPEGFVGRIREWRQAEAMGYQLRSTFLRDLRAASAIHGPRVQARMEIAIAEHRRRR